MARAEPQTHLSGFASFAFRRWKPLCGSLAIAVILSGAASIALPKRYTATASVLIELPAGSDPRAAAALSPVYLESLKTYEHFASSDTIFLDAMQHLGLRSRLPAADIESMKRSVLRISKPASTRVLEISATLDDPKAAQVLAGYIAGRTVDLNRSLETRSAHDVVSEAEAVYKSAEERFIRADRRLEQFSRLYQVEALGGSVDNLLELQFDIERDLQESKASLDEFEARARAGGDEAEDIAGVRARVATLQRQDASISSRIARDSGRIENLKARREQLNAELKAARAEAEAAKTRLNDARASMAFQGERVSILDPGIVPERPSFPNLPLNVAVACVLSIAGFLLFTAWQYGGESARERVEKRTGEPERIFSLVDERIQP